MLFLWIECDQSCASGCVEKKEEGKCDTLCKDGHVLSEDDFECKCKPLLSVHLPCKFFLGKEQYKAPKS